MDRESELMSAFQCFGVLILMIAIAWFMFGNVYRYWSEGVEKEALIIARDTDRYTSRRRPKNYYLIEIDGERWVEGFRSKLLVFDRVSMLTLPGAPEKAIIGSSENSMYELYAYIVGGHINATMYLVIYLASVVISVRMIIAPFRNRRKTAKSDP